MSRIGKQPISIPSGVELKVDGRKITVKGGKGELSWEVPISLELDVKDGTVEVVRKSTEKFARAMHGTARSLISNMIEGVDKGYTRELEIQGVGFKAAVQGKVLVLNLGYSHPINHPIPDGIEVKVDGNTKVAISGYDKQVVGQMAAAVRSYYKAEPYKGKGVRYKGENVRRKVGKAVA